MAAVKGKDTSIELIVRKTLHRMGLRFRLDNRRIPGNPDVTFRRWKIAIFINGCFWHGHSCKRGARMPKTNRKYWEAKIGRNLDRDERAREQLGAAGWSMLVIWECDLEGGITQVVNHIERSKRGLPRGDDTSRANGKAPQKPLEREAF